MASFADALKKAVTQSANAGVKAAQKSSPRAANNTRARDDRGTQAQPAQNWGFAPVLQPAQMMQAPVNQEEESNENSEDLGQTFGSIAKKIAESPTGSGAQEKFNQENTMTDAELRSRQAPWDQLLSAIGLGPEIAYADTGQSEDNGGASQSSLMETALGPEEASRILNEKHLHGGAYDAEKEAEDTGKMWGDALNGIANQFIPSSSYFAAPSPEEFSSEEDYRNALYDWAKPTITASSALMPGAAMPVDNLDIASAGAMGQLIPSQAERYGAAVVDEDEREKRKDRAAKQKESIEAAKADPASAARQNGDEELAVWIDGGMQNSDPKKQSDLTKRYSQLISDIESGKTVVEKPENDSSAVLRNKKNTFLSDYYDYLDTAEGQNWAKLYEEYADPNEGLANLLASGDIDAFMQLLGASDGWNGSTRLRARYNNSVPGLYDWYNGEFNEDARNMLSDYIWGDRAISELGLAEGTDYLGRTLSPEDANLLAQWSNYLADNRGFGNPMNNYNLDARDAALFLYATAMSGDNALDFDQDITNHMLERAGVTQRVGQVGEGSKSALPTLEARKYAIPDLYAANTAENALNPILDNKNTGYYDRALLASIIAAANADNPGKYGIYDI